MRAEYDFSKGKRGAVIPQKGKTNTHRTHLQRCAANRDLMQVIAEQSPGSLDELARITGSRPCRCRCRCRCRRSAIRRKYRRFSSTYDVGSVQGLKTATRARE